MNNLLKQNMPEEVASKVGGKVCTFGSFRLGVNSVGGDIDTLCIAPRHIDRSDFFTSFAELLKRQPEIEKFMVKFPDYLSLMFCFEKVVLVGVSSVLSKSSHALEIYLACFSYLADILRKINKFCENQIAFIIFLFYCLYLFALLVLVSKNS